MARFQALVVGGQRQPTVDQCPALGLGIGEMHNEAGRIGELRGVMRARYGEKVKLRPFAAERRRWPFWRRLPFAGEPVAAIADLADWIEARLLWASFGL